jgi:sugar lactone lactonase YvrE
MKKTSYFASMLFMMIGLVFSLPANAAISWEWDLTLQEVPDRGVMNLPTALYIDEELERYYVVDSGNNRLLSYSFAGEFLSGFTAGNQLQTPFDMIREEGVVWVVEKGRNSLTRIDLKAKKITPKTLSDQGQTVFPDRLDIEKNTLYLLDKAKGKILALDKNLEISKRYVCNDCESGFVDFKIKNNKIWALEQQEKAVYVFAMNGTLKKKIELQSDEIDFPRSLAIDDNELIFILDRHKSVVAIFDEQGDYKYSFLDGGQARGQIYYPIEIKFDPRGRLCVVEEGNGRIQVFVQK